MLDIALTILLILSMVKYADNYRNIKGGIWPVMSFSCLIFYQITIGLWSDWRSVEYLVTAMVSLSVAYVAFRNPQLRVLLVFSAGIALNRLVIFLNSGFMPVSPEAVIRWRGELMATGHSGELLGFSGYKYVTESTILPILGDWIYFPGAGCVFSIGDVVIMASLALFIYLAETER